MKRKIFLLMAISVLSFSLLGCSKEVENECPPEGGCGVELPDDENYCGGCGYCADDIETLETTDAEAQTSLEYDGLTFSLYGDGTEILDKLGEPLDTCEFDSYVYNTYKDITLEYTTIDDKPAFDYIYVTGDSYKASGITIGASKDEVKEAFGEPSTEYECEGSEYMDYYYDDFSQYFTFENGELVEFSFSRCFCVDDEEDTPVEVEE